MSFSCFPWINCGVSWCESHLWDSEGPQGASRGGVSNLSGHRLFPKFTQDKPCEINLVVPRMALAGIFLAEEEIQRWGVLSCAGGREENPHSVSAIQI